MFKTCLKTERWKEKKTNEDEFFFLIFFGFISRVDLMMIKKNLTQITNIYGMKLIY